MNQIEGSYPLKPPRLPGAVGGNEGVARVLAVGSAVKHLQPGDLVISANPGMGTWREEAICPTKGLIKVPQELPIEAAATLLVNPCTAYQMLRNIRQLAPGDLIIQNGANSAVGRFVIQLCKIWGIRCISVIRDRPEYEQLERELFNLGSATVVKAERLPLPETQEYLRSLFKGQRPVLGLNCVGGQAALDLARLLQDGSPLVTYGAMSKKPLTIPTGMIIFNDIKFCGYWISKWYQKVAADPSLVEENQRMFQEIIGFYMKGLLTVPAMEKVHIDDFKGIAWGNLGSTKKLLVFE